MHRPDPLQHHQSTHSGSYLVAVKLPDLGSTHAAAHDQRKQVERRTSATCVGEFVRASTQFATDVEPDTCADRFCQHRNPVRYDVEPDTRALAGANTATQFATDVEPDTCALASANTATQFASDVEPDTRALAAANDCNASSLPTSSPTPVPSLLPTLQPSSLPTSSPTPVPSLLPTLQPSSLPTSSPTPVPSLLPTLQPSLLRRGPHLEAHGSAVLYAEPCAVPSADPGAYSGADSGPTLEPTPSPSAFEYCYEDCSDCSDWLYGTCAKSCNETGMACLTGLCADFFKPTPVPTTPTPSTPAPTPLPSMVPTMVEMYTSYSADELYLDAFGDWYSEGGSFAADEPFDLDIVSATFDTIIAYTNLEGYRRMGAGPTAGWMRGMSIDIINDDYGGVSAGSYVSIADANGAGTLSNPLRRQLLHVLARGLGDLRRCDGGDDRLGGVHRRRGVPADGLPGGVVRRQLRVPHRLDAVRLRFLRGEVGRAAWFTRGAARARGSSTST